MSDNDVHAFLTRVKSDPDFRDRLLEPADAESRLAAARREGYAITLDELGELARRLRDADIDDLYAAGLWQRDARIEPQ
jgi:predicted ribosomally synthesized peptide with nif11-like leader